jgi:hypothetical protein
MRLELAIIMDLGELRRRPVFALRFLRFGPSLILDGSNDSFGQIGG